jgi:hypothetical protein
MLKQCTFKPEFTARVVLKRGPRMNCKSLLQVLIRALIGLLVAGCCGRDRWLTVSEVWQSADSLDGKRICVRGQADFDFIPHHPLQVGGCIPNPDVPLRPYISGKLALLDEDSPDPEHTILISESSLQCKGNTCHIVCRPFGPSDTWGSIGVVEVFEFVGVLRVDAQGSNVVLTLEDLNLRASRRMTDGKWGPIETGEFSYFFP